MSEEHFMPYIGDHYNPKIWEDLDMDEKHAYHIYEAFQKEYNRLVRAGKLPPRKWLATAECKSCPDFDRDGKYPADPIREHKNWEIFTAVWDKYKDESSFNYDIFVKGAFYYRPEIKQIYPRMLLSEDCHKSYHQYLEKIIMDANAGTDEDNIIISLTQTRKTICKILRLNPTEMPSKEQIERFFTRVPKGNVVSEGIRYCFHGMISPYFLVMSKTFRSVYEKLDPDMKAEIGFESEADMEVYVGLVRSHTKAYRAAKAMFGEDII